LEEKEMLQVYEGYIEQGRFYPSTPLRSFQGRKRVIVTVLDEPASYTNGCPLRGMFSDGKISASKFMENKQAEKELER
jgi:hypothetical protein